MRKRTTKSLLAIVMTAVLVFGMAVPGFAVYGYENGGSDNGIYADVATGQTATPSVLPTTETQIVSPTAFSIDSLYIPIMPLSDAPIQPSVGVDDSGPGWVWNGTTLTLTLTNANLTFDSGSTPFALPGNSTIILNGNSTVTNSVNFSIAIFVGGALTIGGTGSLVTNAPNGISAIGITINSGNITINASHNSAINAATGILTINGGTITVSNSNPFGLTLNGSNINITGGIVRENGVLTGGSVSGASVTVSGTFTYNGSPHTPTPTVALNGTNLTLGTNFTVTGHGNNTNAGMATVTVTGAGNFRDTATGNFIIDRAAGATIQTAPTMAIVTHNTITVNAAALNTVPTSPQTIEYAISNNGTTAPTTGWGSNLTFAGLTPNTQYFVWARSAQNENRYAGTAVASAGITTDTAPATDHAITVNNGIANHATAPQGQTVTITANAPSAGQQFVNWTSTSTGVTITNPTLADGATFVMPDNAVTITANFEQIQPTTHTVTFNLNNGNINGNTANVVMPNVPNGTGVTPPSPTRSNHSFNGWTSSVAGMTPANITGDVTFTAQWTYTGTPSTGNGGWSEPSTNYGSLSPSSVNFDLASPRNLTTTLNRGDFTFQNAIRFGTGTNAVNLVRDRDFTATANNNNTTTITIMAEWLSEHMTVGTRHLTFVMSGNNTLSFRLNVTDTRPATTDPTPTMPIVQVDLSPALRAELMERLGDRFDDLEVIVTYDIAQTTPQGAPMGDIHGFWDVIVEFIVRGDSADGSDDEIITGFVNHYYLSADMSNFYLGNLNHHRITALNTTSNEYRQYGYIGSIVGGKVVFDPIVDIEAETPTEIATFALQSNHTGGFMIAYVRNLIRLDLNLTSPLITDLAGNAPQQTMDVLPIIQDSRTLIPIRFIGEALGAELDWTPATADRPLIAHIMLNSETLDIPIGEITPQLAALGMDVPAQIMVNRTMVPLRFVSEFFGAVVNWDNDERSIEIIHLPNNPQPTASSNANHNPLTGRADMMVLAREDEDEVVPNA